MVLMSRRLYGEENLGVSHPTKCRMLRSYFAAVIWFTSGPFSSRAASVSNLFFTRVAFCLFSPGLCSSLPNAMAASGTSVFRSAHKHSRSSSPKWA